MSERDRERWERKYLTRQSQTPSPPADWLVRHVPLLSPGARVLDLAAGDGGNAIFLSQQGFMVTAVDISPAGLAIGSSACPDLHIQWQVADLDTYMPDPGFAAVVVFRFLDRQRLRSLVDQALAPGGLLIAETFNLRQAEQAGGHVRNPQYLLQPDEWLRLFHGYGIIEHEEHDIMSGIVARKKGNTGS